MPPSTTARRLAVLLLVVCWRAAAALSAAPLTDSVTAAAGRLMVLPCGDDIDNSQLGAAAVTWHHRPTDGSTEPAIGAGYAIQPDRSLLVDRVQPGHEGRFTCTDVHTDQLIAVYDLKVRKPSVVRLTTNSDEGSLSEGDTFSVTCHVMTDSVAHAATLLLWRADTLLAPDPPRVTLTTQRAHNVWRLSVANVTRADAGRYICRAKTFFDRAEAEAQLTVAPRVAVNCNSSSAELRWSADTASPGGFIVRMTVDGTVADEALVPGNRTSVQVFDLQPGSQARFQVTAAEDGAVPGNAGCFVPVEKAIELDNDAQTQIPA